MNMKVKTQEIWRSVIGFDGSYEVSNLGNVRSLNYNRTKKIKLLKPSGNTDGYLRVKLCKEGKTKMCSIHRLVAQAFLENPEVKEQVNHRDGVKTNNCVDNLEWCTCSENITHAYRSGLRGDRGKNHSRISSWS